MYDKLESAILKIIVLYTKSIGKVFQHKNKTRVYAIHVRIGKMSQTQK